MEDGAVNTTACYIRWAAQDGLNGRLSSSFTIFIFDLQKHAVPKIKSQNIDEFS
jgi:hypothetical protein